jgi:hypothetical protein
MISFDDINDHSEALWEDENRSSVFGKSFFSFLNGSAKIKKCTLELFFFQTTSDFCQSQSFEQVQMWVCKSLFSKVLENKIFRAVLLRMRGNIVNFQTLSLVNIKSSKSLELFC